MVNFVSSSGEICMSELVERIRNILDESKAVDISVLDVRELTSVTDFMVICSGTSSRHVASLAHKLMDTLKQESKISPLHCDGLTIGEWVLVDYADVVVHIMRPETRAFYHLEGLWGAPPAASQKQQ